MTVDENINLMRRWFREVWNEGNLETVRELFHPDGVAVGQAGAQAITRGPKEFVPFVERIRGAFPDINVTIDDAFGSGDKVVVRWTARMKHTGDTLGPASGKPVRVTGMSIARIAGGKIMEGWDNWDQLGMLEQIGAYKQPDTVTLAKTA
jgi:steroid delta-isomerase-like uncharacterized protein